MRNVGNSQVGKNAYAGSGNDIIHARLYFGDNDGATSKIQAKEYRIFQQAVGDNTLNISSGATVTLSEADTSLEGKGGTIPNGEKFIIYAVGINVALSNCQATEPFTNNAVVTINITPVFRVSPQPLLDALMLHCTFELYRNSDERLERGNISEYPCEFGRFVAAGGSGASVPALAAGAQNAYTVNPFQYIESAGSRFRDLPVYNELAALDSFYGLFNATREIDLASTLLCGAIDFYLVGMLNVDIVRNQIVYRNV